MPFKKGQIANPKGRPGGHHDGRPKSVVKKLARKRSLEIIRRVADIAIGKNLELLKDEKTGAMLKLPAAVREQLVASKIVLTVAKEMGPEIGLGEDGEAVSLNINIVNYKNDDNA